ncbi:MAG: hypothetical protein ACOC1U_10505 [Spirochaetota bacterium]
MSRARGDAGRAVPVVILSGPIRSGKTTALAHLLAGAGNPFGANDPSITGVLAPIIAGRRHLCLLRTGECRLLETDATTPDTTKPGEIVAIGPHRFSERVFSWARNELTTSPARTAEGWVVVDEVGPLELRGEGLEPALGDVIARHLAAASFRPQRAKTEAGPRLLLVVREGLVERVRAHYRIPSERSLAIKTNELARALGA